MSHNRRLTLPLIFILAAGACSSEKTATAPASPAPQATATPAATTPPAAVALPPGVMKIEHAEGEAGPHNLWWVRQPGTVDGQGGLISGAVPENDADFAHLASLGVKTIITVDGSAPDVAAAQRHGMTYIHLPATYARVNPEEQLEVARAISTSLPKGTVYIHCHHGKHRSPAQAAAAAVGLGWMTPEQAVAFMKKAGTAESYGGLYSCVAESKPLDAAIIKAPVRPGEFVALHKPTGIVDAMVEIDLAFDHLTAIKDAGWKTPADSPDLVPAAEAGRLADHLRYSAADDRSKARGDAFLKSVADAAAKASALEEGFVRKEPKEELDTLWTPVAASCKDCHKQYRDKR